MMAPERYEEAAATTAPVSSGIADAAQPGSAVSDGRDPRGGFFQVSRAGAEGCRRGCRLKHPD